MVGDWTDPLDPLGPVYPYLWGQWVCPDCAEDGDAAGLVNGGCPCCGAPVERVP